MGLSLFLPSFSDAEEELAEKFPLLFSRFPLPAYPIGGGGRCKNEDACRRGGGRGRGGRPPLRPEDAVGGIMSRREKKDEREKGEEGLRYYFRIEGPWRKKYFVKSRFSAVPFPEVSFQSFRGRNISLLVFDFPLLISQRKTPDSAPSWPICPHFFAPPGHRSSLPATLVHIQVARAKPRRKREGGGKVGFILGEGGGCSCPSFQHAWENTREGGCLAGSKDRPIVEKRLLPQNALLMSFFPFFLPAKNGGEERKMRGKRN